MSFSLEIAKFGDATAKRVQQVRRGVTLKLFNSVILDTPVDTGRARANWQVSEAEPKQETVDRVDKSGRGPMAEVEAVTNKSDGDVSLFLSNNLPYIEGLENGTSKKAPEGMVRKNVLRFGRLIKIQVATK